LFTCRYFKIQELVPPTIYDARGEKAWKLIDDRGLSTMYKLRERYGPITVNNWHSGKNREWSGLRTPESPYFSPTSQHTFGRAADCIFHRTDAGTVRRNLLAGPDDSVFELITSIEMGVSWFHFDVRNCERIKAFHPG